MCWVFYQSRMTRFFSLVFKDLKSQSKEPNVLTYKCTDNVVEDFPVFLGALLTLLLPHSQTDVFHQFGGIFIRLKIGNKMKPFASRIT